jgi:hypothetical protein
VAWSTEYVSWYEMIRRCSTSCARHKDYIDKGISVCDRRANSFDNFFNRYG